MAQVPGEMFPTDAEKDFFLLRERLRKTRQELRCAISEARAARETSRQLREEGRRILHGAVPPVES